MARKSKAKTPKADLAEQTAAQETECVLSDEAVPTVSEPEKAAEEVPSAVEAAAPAEESEKPAASRRRTAKSKPIAEKPKRAKGTARRKKNADAAQAEEPKAETPEAVDGQAAEIPAEKPMTAKKPGRKPMSEAEKAANAKLREEEKKKAASMVPTLTLQYGGRDVDLKALEQAARDDFKANHKRTLLTELNLYLKPEENTLYYVANGSIEGKIVF